MGASAFVVGRELRKFSSRLANKGSQLLVRVRPLEGRKRVRGTTEDQPQRDPLLGAVQDRGDPQRHCVIVVEDLGKSRGLSCCEVRHAEIPRAGAAM